jgi:hypothetical protein
LLPGEGAGVVRDVMSMRGLRAVGLELSIELEWDVALPGRRAVIRDARGASSSSEDEEDESEDEEEFGLGLECE